MKEQAAKKKQGQVINIIVRGAETKKKKHFKHWNNGYIYSLYWS